jgi:hypothetical protein
VCSSSHGGWPCTTARYCLRTRCLVANASLITAAAARSRATTRQPEVSRSSRWQIWSSGSSGKRSASTRVSVLK